MIARRGIVALLLGLASGRGGNALQIQPTPDAGIGMSNHSLAWRAFRTERERQREIRLSAGFDAVNGFNLRPYIACLRSASVAAKARMEFAHRWAEIEERRSLAEKVWASFGLTDHPFH